MAAYNYVPVGIPYVGYGRMGAEFINCLQDRVELRDDAETVIYGMTPDMVKGWYEGQTVACMTMWESTVLPDRYRLNLRHFDTILVPCDWNKELFDPHHHDVRVAPLGIDLTVWSPTPKMTNDKFIFMTGGSGWMRKGIDQVIRAFRDANLPDSELVIKCPPVPVDDPLDYSYGPNITVIKQALSVAQEVLLHNQADCFVSASRGEGFGLIPLQQRALGNWVIAPTHTGHAMYADLIDYPLSSTAQPAKIMHYQNIGDWFVPDHDEMVEAMRDAYQRGPAALWERFVRHEETEPFSWEAATDTLLDVFPPSGILHKPKWVESGASKLKVVVLRNFQAHIGNYRVHGTKGEVKDIPISAFWGLNEAGYVSELP